MLWLAEDGALSQAAASALDDAHGSSETIWVSPISAWEIGLLVTRGRIALSTAPRAWFRRVLAQPGIGLCEIEPDVLIDSSFLPGEPPRDPADRIILATARLHGYRILTRDRAMLAYAAVGHASAIPC
jgi:PIN domain nuclease of toxin-antitoxin system